MGVGKPPQGETIAYSKRRTSVLEGCAILGVFLNFQKSFSEKKRDATPAQRLGVATEKLGPQDGLAQRLFPSRVTLAATWERYYRRDVVTRCLPDGRRHRFGYAHLIATSPGRPTNTSQHIGFAGFSTFFGTQPNQ